MELPVPIRRLIYRVGYRILQAIWLVTKPTLRGVKCVLTDGDRVLLVRHTYGRRWWDVPGGAIQRGEPPGQAAHREMSEELGLTDVDWRPVGEIEVANGRRTDHLTCFVADLHQPVIEIDRGELAEARWFARDRIPSDSSPHLEAILGLPRPRAS
ncbi:MAG TPA: NUDIX domain-containing protein [Solirubrobacteraceae bacterium]|jgi:8-oxo-dGTP pyrophosphatase MutT (NUDIX family)|nr:NUDIX domain-containing protein [Solirubrobacteraceae bacterium]